MNWSLTIGWIFIITIIGINSGKPGHDDEQDEPHDPRHIKCTKNGSIKILVVNTPPYVTVRNRSMDSNGSALVEGVLVDFFMSAIRMCYKECNITFQVRYCLESSFYERFPRLGTFHLLLYCISTDVTIDAPCKRACDDKFARRRLFPCTKNDPLCPRF